MKKITVVSGGSGGLGLEIAKLIVKTGRNVLILGRDSIKLALAERELKSISENTTVNILSCNIGHEPDVKEAGRYITENGFVTEYLFNNAGRGLFTKAETSTSEMIDDVFEANIKGMILLTSKILSITPKEQELTIVNIMSTSALYGRDEETIYCAAKWGARGYTEALRTELKGTKRNIIAVYPGGMKTDFWKVPGQSRDTSGFMDPEEVAKKIVDAVIITDKMFVTDITINRKK